MLLDGWVVAGQSVTHSLGAEQPVRADQHVACGCTGWLATEPVKERLRQACPLLWPCTAKTRGNTSSRSLLPAGLLYNRYGSYEISNDPYFSSSRLSLLDRGFIFAIAHIRGGGEMGR